MPSTAETGNQLKLKSGPMLNLSGKSSLGTMQDVLALFFNIFGFRYFAQRERKVSSFAIPRRATLARQMRNRLRDMAILVIMYKTEPKDGVKEAHPQCPNK